MTCWLGRNVRCYQLPFHARRRRKSSPERKRSLDRTFHGAWKDANTTTGGGWPNVLINSAGLGHGNASYRSRMLLRNICHGQDGQTTAALAIMKIQKHFVLRNERYPAWCRSTLNCNMAGLSTRCCQGKTCEYRYRPPLFRWRPSGRRT